METEMSLEWLTGAKREDTRQRGLQDTLARIVEGKSQNWKYIRR